MVGAIGYDTHSGLGHLMRDFHAHGIVDRVLVIPHPRYERHPEWYAGSRYDSVPKFLHGLKWLLVFENAFNKWDVVKLAKKQGVKFALMPMYEWTPNPLPVKPDLILCPSDLDYGIFKGVRINVPVEQTWKLRETAKVFVHNAGHGQVGFAKGTPEVIAAWDFVRSDAKLLVRGQPDEPRVKQLLVRLHPRIVCECRQLDDSELYATGDVFINAERYNGLSLPLQEAFASGMPIVTTDRYPANTWLPKQLLVPPSGHDRHIVNQTTFRRETVDPCKIAEHVDFWYGRDVSAFSEAGRVWAEANSWAVLSPKYKELLS